LEWAGFPLLGGSTDIGVQLGAVATLTLVAPRIQPYAWRVDGIASLSVKSGPRGTEVVQQSHGMRWDLPVGGGGRIRLIPAIYYDKTINAGYFGLGNAAPVITNADGAVGDRYQFRHEEFGTRVLARTPISGALGVMYGWQFRYVNPKPYAFSALAIDASTRLPDGRPKIYGMQPTMISTLNGGLLHDTRNDEVFPKHGVYNIAAVRASTALPSSSNMQWLGFNVTLQGYTTLPGNIVLAGRLMGDAMTGNVPFYDLSQGGAFELTDMPGGGDSIRGVPNGRYSGLLKALANIELRRMNGSVQLFGSTFQIGTTAFIDTGRIWSDYSFRNPQDGSGIGLKYGVGGGPIVIWDTAAVFRIDVAYSPDATAANPGFPIGVYVNNGVLF